METYKELLKNSIKDIVYLILIYINKIILHLPRKKNLWVFGAWRGQLYSDNSKYMFEYMNTYHPEIKTVWISRKKEVVQEVRKKGYIAYHHNNILGMFFCLRAEAAFLTEDRHDISRILISGAEIIQLWHGMGIKDITNFFPVHTSKLQRKYNAIIHSHQDEYWMVACEEAVKKYSNAFSLSRERMFITGQPKDDTFIILPSNTFINKIRKQHFNCKIAVYLPTHRNFGSSGTTDILSINTLKNVNNELAQKNIVLIFKPHAHEFKNYMGLNEKFSNIIFATDSKLYGDVYEFLPACDMMITDYSGIMLGYLASQKPIIYFVYDYDDYLLSDAGFCYKYEEVTAGPICREWDEVLKAMEVLMCNDSYATKRENLKNKFCPLADGRSCERIYSKVVEIRKARNS